MTNKLKKEINSDSFNIEIIKSGWVQFYKKYFNLVVDFSDLVLPKIKSGQRCIIIVPGIIFDRIIARMRLHYKVCVSIKMFGINFREDDCLTDKSYAVAVYDCAESDR